MANRIESIDILRGFAVLQMIFWQIFDFFSKENIYDYASFYHIPFFNMPIHGTGLALFTLASGASVYISVIGSLKKKINITSIVLHSIKRYGGYILLSLFFTTYVFGFRIFYVWTEVIQGIGLAALIAAILILISKSKWFYAILAIIIAFLQPFLRMLLENDFIIRNYPLEPVTFNIITNSISLLLNATIRGFFSLTHTLPLLLFGVVLAIIIVKSDKIHIIKTTFLVGILLTAVSIFMHFSFNKIDVYNWSSAYQIGFVGISFLVFSLIEFLLLKFGKNRISEFLNLFGKTAIIAYLFHFVVIFKSLEVLNVESTLGQPISYVLTIISVIITYYVCKIWLFNKKALFRKIKQMTNSFV